MLTLEGDIFEGCRVSWTPYKTCLLSELYNGKLKLEGYSILDVTPEVVFEVETTEGANLMVVRINCPDNVIGEIQQGWRQNELAQKFQLWKSRLEEMKRQMDKVERELVKMIAEDMTCP